MGARKERARVSLVPVLSCAHYFLVQAMHKFTLKQKKKIAAAAPAVLPFSKMAVAQREATFSAL